MLMTQFRFQLYGIFDMVTPYEVILKQPIMKKCYANNAMQLKAKNFVWNGFSISITFRNK